MNAKIVDLTGNYPAISPEAALAVVARYMLDADAMSRARPWFFLALAITLKQLMVAGKCVHSDELLHELLLQYRDRLSRSELHRCIASPAKAYETACILCLRYPEKYIEISDKGSVCQL